MYKSKAVCPDGRIRTVWYDEPDTFFSAPAYTFIKVGGRSKRISGFVSVADKYNLPPSLIPESKLEFTAHQKFLKVMPNHLLTVKAMWEKSHNWHLSNWRWVWDGLRYSEKWGIG